MKLQKAGNSWKGKCPFHNEKTPSFMVNEDRQFYYCFGCSEGGDIYNFIQKIENMDFPEALKLLADKVGVKLEKMDKRAQDQKTRLQDVLEEATKFWQKNLYSGKCKQALDYLRSRDLDDDTISNFRLGYASESWDEILNYLKSKGYTEYEISEAGLSIPKKQGSGYYARFRDRIIFPIANIHGNIVGFTARALKSDETAKYINTPETIIYKKGGILYGFDKAKQEIKKKNFVIIVEGNMDVIASHKINVQNVIAVSGTALTEQQINLIKRYTTNIAFCFDMDEAGQRAAKRSIDMALKLDVNTKIIQPGAGKDPDDCIRSDPKLWIKAIEEAVSIMGYYFKDTFGKLNASKVDDKKKIAQILLTEINKIANPIEKDYWLKELANQLDVSEQLLREILSKNKQNQSPSQPSNNNTQDKKVEEKQKTKTQMLHELMFSILFCFPGFVKYCSANLDFTNVDKAFQKLYKNMIVWYNENNGITKEDMTEKVFSQNNLDLEKAELEAIAVLMDEQYPDCSIEQFQGELVKIVSRIKEIYNQNKVVEIEKKLKQAELVGDKEIMNKLMSELQTIHYKKLN